MEELWSKILVMFLLGGISMLLGFIPLKLGNWFKNQDGSPRHGTIFSSLLCYGGGVLLATSLIHMLPEVNHYKFEFQSQNSCWWNVKKIRLCKVSVMLLCRSARLLRELIYIPRARNTYLLLKSCWQLDFFSFTSSRNLFIQHATPNCMVIIMKNHNVRS